MSKKAPRLWDRKPMTPFNSRSKTRKVWKRFLASTTSDNLGGEADHGPFLTEINNSSALRDVLRGIKRRCTATGVGIERGRSFLETKWEKEDMGARKRKYVPRAELGIRGSVEKSAVEEPDTVTDVNKLDEHVEGRLCAETAVDQDELGLKSLASQHEDPDPTLNPPRVIEEELEENGSDVDDKLSPQQSPENNSKGPEDPAKLQGRETDVDPPAIQDATETGLGDLEFDGGIALVRSSLNETATTELPTAEIEDVAEETRASPLAIPPRRRLFPRLEGDDAEFLSDFLSQAQAKRAAAKSAAPNKSPELSNCEGVARSPTPRARRVLEDLDKNSPSSPRQLSPLKLKLTPASPSPKFPLATDPEQDEKEQEKRVETGEDQQQPRVATPWRRSARKPIARIKRHTPMVPNHIPVRRSNGTEFVFLQRSEEQQLSLTTKANTRFNKGEAQLPHLILDAINAEYDPSSSNGDAGSSASPRKSPRKRMRIVKKVMWDDEHLVRYEGETYDNEEQQNVEIGRKSHQSPKPAISQPAKREKKKGSDAKAASKSSDKSKTDKQPLLTHSQSQRAKSPTVTRKVRKLGFSGNSELATIAASSGNNLNATLADAAKNSTAPASGKTSTKKIASSHPGTPIQRKKLAPKSPKAIAFKVSDDRGPAIGTTTATTRSAARAVKFSGSCLPRHTGRTRLLDA